MNRRYLRLVFRLYNDNFTKSGCFIRFNLISDILNNTLKFNLTSSLSDNNSVERIPLSNKLTFLNHFSISHIQCRAIRYIVSRQNYIRINIHETHFSQTTYYYFRSFTGFINNVYSTEFFKLQTSCILSYNTCIGCNISSSTTGMEGTQSQLCTRFTN